MVQMTVTAVIPTYNCAHLLGRAIDSVLGQTRPVDELIVIDDGSSDETLDVIARYDNQVRYIFQENRGVSAARNRGIAEAQSAWIAFLDSDDEWLPNKIKLQCGTLWVHPDAVLCYAPYWWVEIGGTAKLRPCVPVDSLWPAIRLRNPFPPSVVMVQKSALQQVGGFNERLGGGEDWDLFIRMAARYKFASVDEPLLRHYEVLSSASFNEARMLPDTLSMVDSSLLINLSGWRRALWRRRIRSLLYYQGAISARYGRRPAAWFLAKSFLNWPSPFFEPNRLKTLAAALLGR